MKISLVVLLAASAAWGQSAWSGAWASHGLSAAGGSNSGGAPPSQAENAYCGLGDAPNFGAADNVAALPTSCVYTAMSGTPAPGATNVVSCGGSVQTAINNASCGDKVVIPAICSGVQNVLGPITLPAKSCDTNHWVWIESDQTTATGFPAEHTRATPCAINRASVTGYPSYPCSSPAMQMPLIQETSGGGAGNEAIVASAGANFYRLIGLEVGALHAVINDLSLIDLTAGSDHIILDRMLVHGEAINCTSAGGTYTCSSGDTKNGVQIQNATNVAIINSWLYDFLCPQGTCTDSHAVGGGNGSLTSHTYKIYNNLIAAAGESFIQGGAGNGVGGTTTTPTDFEIRANHSFKPVSWQLCTQDGVANCGGMHPELKNLGEFKNGQRILVEGNVFENSWTGWQTDQSGYGFLLTPKNQNTQSTCSSASSDGAGTLTCLSGTFSSNVVSVSCALPNQCLVKYNNVGYHAQSFVDSTHITVSPAPPVTASANVSAYLPGLNPTAIVTDVTVRFNEFRNVSDGIQFAASLSDGNDVSLGLQRASLHDNLFHGVNSDNNNRYVGGAVAKATCFQSTNSQNNPINLRIYTFDHNTCAIAKSGNFGASGLDVTLDSTDSTTSGSTGAYFQNRVITNNLGPAGGIVNYQSGTIYPGGLATGLAQQSCTPPVTGGTCSWTYSRNVLGQNLWTNQTFNSPFPSTNQTCNGSSATCFPSGAVFTSLVVNYNGPNGQPGYLGDYHLAANGPYAGAGLDGKDVGANVAQILSLTSGVWSATSYTSAHINTATLPNATVATAYSQQLAAGSASDMQVWRVISGSLPAGLSLSFAGIIFGTPTTSGTSNFTVQMMDAAQQYATQGLSLTVQ